MHARTRERCTKGAKALKKLSVAEYAKKVGKNESTIRRAIQAGRLHAIKEMVNNRPVYKIPVEGEDAFVRAEDSIGQAQDARVHDAILIDDSDKFALVSMEKGSFDDLISNIKELSDARAGTMQAALDSLKEEYFELKAMHLKMQEEYRACMDALKDELMQEKIKSAQFEAEVRINEVQLSEQANSYKKQIEKLKEKNKHLEQTVQEQLGVLQGIQVELKTLKSQEVLKPAQTWIEKL